MKSKHYNHNQNHITLLKFKIYSLYKNDFNYIHIGHKLSLDPKTVESYLLSYIRTHNIDTEQLEKDRDEVRRLNIMIASNDIGLKPCNIPLYQHSKTRLNSAQNNIDYKLKDAKLQQLGRSLRPQIEKPIIKEIDLRIIKLPSRYQRFATKLCNILCFWR
jgi:hypothetical protein